MASSFTESIVEAAAPGWLEELGYAVLYGPDIAAGDLGAERSAPAFRDVVLDTRLRNASARLSSLSASGPRTESSHTGTPGCREMTTTSTTMRTMTPHCISDRQGARECRPA